MRNKWRGVRRDVCPVGFNWQLANKPHALVVLNSLLSHHGLYLYHGSVRNMKYAVAFRCKGFVPGSRKFLFLNFPRVRLAKIIVTSPPESSLLSIKPLVRRLLKLECFDFVCLHFPKLPRACIPRYTHAKHEPILKIVK